MIKLSLKEIPNRYDYLSIFHIRNIGNIYEGELCPTTYDPYTLKPASPAYVIKCDDGKLRKVDASFFITFEEMRNEKLNELGI
jgi:hypothetical protein